VLYINEFECEYALVKHESRRLWTSDLRIEPFDKPFYPSQNRQGNDGCLPSTIALVDNPTLPDGMVCPCFTDGDACEPPPYREETHNEVQAYALGPLLLR
jgi:hypothetical protein